MKIVLVCIQVLLAVAVPGLAGDWPMWRYDAARSAASPDGIADSPTLLWCRKLPPVKPAWPLEVRRRLSFDASYEPVVMGKLLFLGSPNDGSVTAYDTNTGEEKWKFYTEGPVRFAPACYNGRIYAGSDDGYLYCLKARTGELLWKSRGAPPERPDYRQIGNGHLVSFWPVRGGPVVKDGVVYFTAGIWPTLGIFVRALDAKTGTVRWTSSELNYLSNVVSGGDVVSDDVGLSPQGYLVAIGDRLVIPQSRSMPAGLELATGKLIYYVTGGKQGDSRVTAHGNYAFVGDFTVVNLYDLREAGSRWAGRGAKERKDYHAFGGNLSEWECPHPYKLAESCDAFSALADNVAYGCKKGVFYAYNLAQISRHAYEVDFDWEKGRQLVWEPALRWQYGPPSPDQTGTTAPKTSPDAKPLDVEDRLAIQLLDHGENKPSSPCIKAGPRLYSFAGKKIIALEGLQKEPHVAWEKDIEGTPSSLIAADGKLFVATAEGSICCFGEGHPGKTFDLPALPGREQAGDAPLPLESKNDGWAEKAEAITKAAGIKSGYCLLLGLKDGRLAEEIIRQTDMLVMAVDSDAAKIAELRAHFDKAGLLGSRIEAFCGNPFDFLFPPYIASLIVSENPVTPQILKTIDMGTIFTRLHPYGGTLCLEMPDKENAGFADAVESAKLANAIVKREGVWSLLLREGALPGSAPWTHEACDAANTFCSQDDLVNAPLGFLWYGDHVGFVLWNHGYDAIRPQVVGGRVFAFRQHGGGILISYDAYTGRFLWKEKIACYARHARLASLADGIYFVSDGKCTVYDPETGKALKDFPFKAPGAATPKDLRVEGDIILIGCNPKAEDEAIQGYGHYWGDYRTSKLLICLDRKTGAELWRREAQERFSSQSLAIGGGTVFCIDSFPMAEMVEPKVGADTSEEKRKEWEEWKQKAEGLKEVESTLFALDPRTGTVRWSRKIRTPYRTKSTPIAWDDWVAYSAEAGLVLAGRCQYASAFDSKTGQPAWENKTVGNAPMIIRGKTFLNQIPEARVEGEGLFDLLTGQPLNEHHIKRGGFPAGCNYAIANKHLLFKLYGTVSYADLDSGTVYFLRNTRSGCVNGLIPADGLVNAPSFTADCTCNYPITTSFALTHMPEIASWSGTTALKVTPPPPLPPETPSPAPAEKLLSKPPEPPVPDSLPATMTLDLGNGMKMELVHIPAGSFLMGSPATETGRYSDETLHAVTITKPFYMGKFPVTQAQYEQVMGANPSRNKAKDNPVERTTRSDAQEFCKKLGEATKQTVRLPTEAEWEYACRAGTRTRYYSGDSEEDLKRAAWYKGNSGRAMHPVGQKEPNAFGLHDMLGNVWQRCQDLYGDYPAEAVADPKGPAAGEWSMLRGGSAFDFPADCRAACRGTTGLSSGYRNMHYFIGFRVVVAIPQK